MESDKSTDNVDVEFADVFSPNWNEFYVDGASITVDEYAVRIAFVNHLPQNLRSGKLISTTRKVDVVMSELAFLNLFKAMCELKDSIEKQEKTVQINEEDLQTNEQG
jgi:hypothetical protein